MKNIILHVKLSFYFVFLLFNLLSNLNYAQSVRRQCFSCYGSIAITDSLLVEQTAGQSYCTTGFFENNIAVLPGFQQPSTFSIEEISSFQSGSLNLNIFPNPANSSFSIENKQGLEQISVQVVNIKGERVLYESFPFLISQNYNCESWENGVYLITIFDTEQRNRTFKLIISK